MTYQLIILVTTGILVSVPQVFMVIQFCLAGQSFLLVFIATLPAHSCLLQDRERFQIRHCKTHEVQLKMQWALANA